jgi:hypothetical protein
MSRAMLASKRSGLSGGCGGMPPTGATECNVSGEGAPP